MGLSSALSHAVSGLGAAGRSAQVVSSNISNALTEGYGRREVVLAPGRLGGVRVADISRQTNTALVQDRRHSDAAAGAADVRADGLSAMSAALGDADGPASISGRVGRLEAQLIETASMPSSSVRLDATAAAAADLARGLNDASDAIQATRLKADAGIARDVEALNAGLARMEELNGKIIALNATGGEVNGLLDERAKVFDRIAGIVPMRTLQRDNGAISLYTTGGQILLDHRAVSVEFAPSNAMAPQATLGSPLSGLTVGGRAIAVNAVPGKMDGGTLAAHFDVRDALGPDAQSRLDAVARDLIERFEDPAADATRLPGTPALFTDGGGPLIIADEVGLSRRIALNASVDPAIGNETWRLRDGLGAVSEGPSGNAAGLQALSDALTLARPASSGDFGATARTAGGLSDTLMSVAGGDVFRAEDNRTFARARADTLREQELADGVDTDAEMQKLLLIEQAYGANARVIQAVEEMLDQLMRI